MLLRRAPTILQRSVKKSLTSFRFYLSTGSGPLDGAVPANEESSAVKEPSLVNKVLERLLARTCFRCGKPGHIAEDCTLKEKICFNCGEPGHISGACPQPGKPKQQRSALKIVCFGCGQKGHMSRDCPAGVKCFACGQTGHMSKECTNARVCYNCGKEGHESRECPDNE